MPTLNPARIGTRYRPQRLQGPYDAIVIGSGMGGLTTAALLSQSGKKVLVLEQHYTAGGFTHSYERNGYEWDVGVHYIGGMGSNSLSRRIMDRLTNGKLDWAPMAACYDRSFYGEQSFDFIAGETNFIANLSQRFPTETKAITAYVKLLHKVAKIMPLHSMLKLVPPHLNRFIKPIAEWFMPRALRKSTYAVLRGLTDNEQLISVLCSQWGDYGAPPKESSFFIHALVAHHYLEGGYYPIGGASRIAATILPTIQASGGNVFTYAAVQEIWIENGKAAGVLMADGTIIKAPIVISNAGVFNTFGKLLPEAACEQLGYSALLDQVKPSAGHLGLYIGLKEDAAALDLPLTNYWIFPSHAHDQNCETFFNDPTQPFPAVYISFPSAKDPSSSSRHPGRATIEIVAPVPRGVFDAWANKPWGKRGDDYEALKEHYAQRLLDVLYEKLPQLKGKVDYYELSTPLSTAYFSAYQHGEMYGLNHDQQRFDQSWLQTQTRLPGLYLTGQDVLSCGVVGAMMAGCMAAIKVLGPQGWLLAKSLFHPQKA